MRVISDAAYPQEKTKDYSPPRKRPCHGKACRFLCSINACAASCLSKCGERIETLVWRRRRKSEKNILRIWFSKRQHSDPDDTPAAWRDGDCFLSGFPMRLKFDPISSVKVRDSVLRHDSSRPPVPSVVAVQCGGVGNSHQRSLDAFPSTSEPPKTYAKAPSPPSSSSRCCCCAPPERGGPPHPAKAQQKLLWALCHQGAKKIAVLACAQHAATRRTRGGCAFSCMAAGERRRRLAVILDAFEPCRVATSPHARPPLLPA